MACVSVEQHFRQRRDEPKLSRPGRLILRCKSNLFLSNYRRVCARAYDCITRALCESANSPVMLRRNMTVVCRCLPEAPRRQPIEPVRHHRCTRGIRHRALPERRHRRRRCSARGAQSRTAPSPGLPRGPDGICFRPAPSITTREPEDEAARSYRLFRYRRPTAAQLPAGAASSCGRSSISRCGTSRGRWRARCCRRRPARRCCPTCRTGPGTNTACASASGASSAVRPARHTPDAVDQRPGLRETIRASPQAARARLGIHGPRLRARPDPQSRGPERHDPPRRSTCIEKFTGKRPVGWLGPGLTQTYETPDLLAEAGVEYIGDWVYDDEPTEIQHRARAARHAPLHGRAQRYPDDDGAAPPRRRIPQPRQRPVRPALSGKRRARQVPVRSPSTPISAACRTGSNISKPSSTMPAAITASPSGPARRSLPGTARPGADGRPPLRPR